MYNFFEMKQQNVHKTKVISVFETFAGIGAQHKAIKSFDNNFQISKTSEWDARAIIAYSQIHNKDKFDEFFVEASEKTEEAIDKYLLERVFSLNSKVPGNVTRKDLKFKKTLYAANEANNNLPNILDVKGSDIEGIDLLTYSFPCQGLSIANMGRDKGIKEDAKSTSNLIWQIRRILLEAKDEKIKLPKYLLMENVKNLISKKHRPDYERWIKFLKDIGYETYTVVLSGLDHGSLQKRERVFGISIQKKYAPKQFTNDYVEKLLKKEYATKLSLEERKDKYFKILKSSNDFKDEIVDATPNDTPSRHRMANENRDLIRDANIKGKEYIFNTLTTKQDRNPNIGMIELKNQTKNKMNKRFITNREAYMIMGFDSEDFDAVKPFYKAGMISKEALYRQAGNSIVVDVLEDVFKLIHDIEKGKYV